MKKKLIGITGPSAFSKNIMTMLEDYCNFNYVYLSHENPDNMLYWLDACDGILISGGIDLHPSIYDHNVTGGNNLSKFDIRRDCKELGIIDYAINQKKPMLAICRGHQLLSVYLGLAGEFAIDLTGCSTVHQPSSRNITATEHDVMHSVDIVKPESFLVDKPVERNGFIKRLGETFDKKMWVNSFHHQGIFYSPGKDGSHYSEKGIEVIATSAADWEKKRKLIELMTGQSWVSVQWHPEYDYEVNTPSRQVLNMFCKLFN
jgi:putative glutamine amidotransferase